jgi:hypothetical protein
MNTIKLSKRSGIILLCILVLFIGAGYYSGFFFNIGITPCLPPPGIRVDGYASARIFTWLDQNMNGVFDAGEVPLSGVKLEYPPANQTRVITNNDGQAETYVFKPGCVCRCWEGEYILVAIPDGYRLTGPVRYSLTENDELFSFGFIRDD